MEHPGLSIDTDEFESPCEFVIFTHSIKTRYLVLSSFCLYLVIFFLFTSHLKDQMEKMEELPAVLRALGEDQTGLLIYVLMGIGILVAILILLYLFWAVVDVWGIQVHLSPRMVQVKNTVTGNYFKKTMGVGELLFEELEEVEGGFFSTRLVGTQGVIRFSPVERIEFLISKIMEYAPKASFNVR